MVHVQHRYCYHRLPLLSHLRLRPIPISPDEQKNKNVREHNPNSIMIYATVLIVLTLCLHSHGFSSSIRPTPFSTLPRKTKLHFDPSSLLIDHVVPLSHIDSFSLLISGAEGSKDFGYFFNKLTSKGTPSLNPNPYKTTKLTISKSIRHDNLLHNLPLPLCRSRHRPNKLQHKTLHRIDLLSQHYPPPLPRLRPPHNPPLNPPNPSPLFDRRVSTDSGFGGFGGLGSV